MTEEVATKEPALVQLVNELVQAAREDTADGFRAFYMLVHGRPVPKHAEAWIDALYAARGKAKGVVIEAFRGSTKTTTMTTFIAWQVGLHPERASLVVQVNDEVSWDNTEKIADIVQHNHAFKTIFPHVVPDTAKGWGASGYEVMRTDMTYPRWRALNSARKDPSFVGMGYKSGSILGKHPDGVLLVDDINDEKNTVSERELATVRKIVTDTIFPTITGEAWNIFIGTPWTVNDVIGYVKSTGQFTPIRTPVVEGEKPTWPERFDAVEIQRQRMLSGELGFARMMLVNVELTKGINLKKEWLHDYPSDRINPTWPVVIGVDYASTADKLKDKERDYFALAVVRKIPGGGLVVVDGVRERLSQGEAEVKLRAMANVFPTLELVAIEAIGKGEEFYNLILRNSRLPVYPCKTGRQSKGERFEAQMAPLFQYSRIWLSDADNEFLKAFRDEWVLWPKGQHDDTLDAVYWACFAAQGQLTPETEKPEIYGPWWDRKKEENPFCSLGEKHG